MRYLLTLVLLLAIPATYYFVGDILQSKLVEEKEYVVNFADDGLGIKKLDGIESFKSITERPLFIESREKMIKVVKKKKLQKKAVVQDIKVQALGIALTSEGILAVLKDLRNGKIIRLRINDEIYGWLLEGVSEDSFMFSKDGQRKLISFKNK